MEEEQKLRTFKATKKPQFPGAPLPARKLQPLTVPHSPELSSYTHGHQNMVKFQQKVRHTLWY